MRKQQFWQFFGGKKTEGKAQKNWQGELFHDWKFTNFPEIGKLYKHMAEIRQIFGFKIYSSSC